MAYSAPSSRSTSDLITAAIWNADVVANPIAIYAGAMSVTSQAVGDILYASSTTQFARIAAVAAGQVLTSAGTGTVPAWSTDLVVSGAGPHAIGGSGYDFVRLLLDGAFTSGGASTIMFGTYMNGALTGHSADSDALGGTKLDNSIVTAGNCTTVAQLWVTEPKITVGSGSVTNSASLYIQGAATEATNDYALWVDAGATQLDGTLDVAGAVTFNDAGADVDFRVESDDDANIFFVDGSTDRIGIGTNAPEHSLTVAAHGGYTTQATVGIDRSPGGGAYSTTGATGMLFIGSHTGSTNNNHTNAAIRFQVDNTAKWALGMTGQAGAPTTEFSLHNMVLDSVPFWIDASSNVVFNEPGIDADFRVETDTLPNMLSIESGSFGGVGTLGIGVTDAFTNLNSWIGIKGPATTCPANEGFKRMRVATNGGAVTIPSGTSSLVATLQIDEPNIIATGTVTEAASLYVSGAPTEGTSNYAFFVDAGVSRFDDFVQVGTTSASAGINSPKSTYFNSDSDDTGTGEVFIWGTNRATTSGGTELMRLTDAGYLGLGTDDPQLEMHLETSGDTGIRLVRSGSFTTVGVLAACHSTEQFVIRTETSNGIRFATNTTSGDWTDNTRMVIRGDGDITINNALSKGSGSFRIDHPLPAKTDTHHLVHSFIEGPKCDLIYRGSATLSAGQATVNLDTASTMSEGTWVLLCRDEQCFTSNETGWSSVRGTVSGNILTIECDDSTSVDTISWMVVAERHDTHIMGALWTDNDGRPIVELEKSEDGPSPSASISPSASPSE